RPSSGPVFALTGAVPPERREPRHQTLTSLSRSIAILIAANAGSPARAQDAPAQAYPPPPAAYAPQDWQTAPAGPRLPPSSFGPPPAPPPSGFERRHQFGLQIGGTGLFQLAYRFRATPPIYFEFSTFGADHGGNASTGLVVGRPVANRWFPYAGF